jgi:hypothetical protein
VFRSSRRILTISLLLVAYPLTAQSPQAKRPDPRVTRMTPDWTASPQELFASYWTLEPGWSTELEIRNNVPWRNLRVTPVLRIATGAEVPLTPVTVRPDEIVSVNLQEAVASVKPELVGKMGSFGSVVFRFEGTGGANAFGAAVVRRDGRPIEFHFDADEFMSNAVEGMWWLPTESSTAYLLLSNPTLSPASAKLTLTDSSGAAHRFALTVVAGQSQRINIREVLRAQAGGVMGGLSLSVSKPGALNASEIVFDEVAGFSALMKLFDRDIRNLDSNRL